MVAEGEKAAKNKVNNDEQTQPEEDVKRDTDPKTAYSAVLQCLLFLPLAANKTEAIENIIKVHGKPLFKRVSADLIALDGDDTFVRTGVPYFEDLEEIVSVFDLQQLAYIGGGFMDVLIEVYYKCIPSLTSGGLTDVFKFLHEKVKENPKSVYASLMKIFPASPIVEDEIDKAAATA